MAAPDRGVSVTDRLRIIAGHLRAVDDLIADGCTFEAVSQLLAVRAAVGAVAIEICRHSIPYGLEGGEPSAPAELLALLRLAAVRRRRPWSGRFTNAA